MLVMYLTGFLLWYGERDTSYRFAGTVMIHDWGTLILIVPGRWAPLPGRAESGHAPRAARHDGRRCRREWARKHHPKWVEELPDAERVTSDSD